MNNNIYPLKFNPILKDKIWGGNKLKSDYNKNSKLNNIGESWEISGVEGDVSVISNGFLKGNNLNEILEIYMGDLVGDDIYQKFGNEFPLLFKFIDAKENLSVQVHPDDNLSKERHNAFGKTEMWYILDNEPNSKIISGFSKECKKEDYTVAVNEGKVEELLKKHTAKKGDVYFIPAGIIHAIGGGVLLVEIQQTSDVTYRVYDYNRKDAEGNLRELHNELAVDAINYKDKSDPLAYDTTKINDPENLVTCQYFTTNLLRLNEDFERDIYLLNSFACYMCTEGEATIKCDNGTEETISKGESVLIPASIQNITIQPKNTCSLLEVYIKQ